jgi:signal transduction histidine kinase
MPDQETTVDHAALRGLLAVLDCPVSPSGLTDGLAAIVERLTGAVGAGGAAVLTRTARGGERVLAASGLDDAWRARLDEEAAELVARAHSGSGDDGDVLAVPVPGTLGETALVVVGPAPDGHVGDAALRAAAERAGAAIEVARLRSDLDRAMAQILETDERLLGRIGLDIHDGPTQQLSVALLEVQLLEAELGDAEAAGEVLPDKLRPALGRIYEVLGGALHEMRELIGHLRPAQFESRTLPEILTDAVRAFEARGDAEATFSVEGDALGEEGITLSQRITFYRILQEALTNAHRHGHARSISVRLRFAREGTTLEVADDGEGFDVDAVAGREGTPRPRFGVVGMRDRANLLGGTIAITSAAGEGTLVAVYLPRWRPDDPAAFPGLDG